MLIRKLDKKRYMVLAYQSGALIDHIHIVGVLEGQERKKGTKIIFEEIMAKNS